MEKVDATSKKKKSFLRPRCKIAVKKKFLTSNSYLLVMTDEITEQDTA